MTTPNTFLHVHPDLLVTPAIGKVINTTGSYSNYLCIWLRAVFKEPTGAWYVGEMAASMYPDWQCCGACHLSGAQSFVTPLYRNKPLPSYQTYSVPADKRTGLMIQHGNALLDALESGNPQAPLGYVNINRVMDEDSVTRRGALAYMFSCMGAGVASCANIHLGRSIVMAVSPTKSTLTHIMRAAGEVLRAGGASFSGCTGTYGEGCNITNRNTGRFLTASTLTIIHHGVYSRRTSNPEVDRYNSIDLAVIQSPSVFPRNTTVGESSSLWNDYE